MSIVEVAVAVSIMGTIAVAIGSIFTAISATHQVSDDLVDARRLISLQFAIYDRAFNVERVRSPGDEEFRGDHSTPSDFLNWQPALPRTLTRTALNNPTPQPFPDLWGRPATYLLQLDVPPGGINFPPTDVNTYLRGRQRIGNQTVSALVPPEPVNNNNWHVWNSLRPEEQTRLNEREIMADVYLAKLEIRDTHVRATDSEFSVNPFRYQVGNQHLWWIAQVDVVRRTGASTTILETAFRIGP